jgi:hypothetical protein
MAKGMSSVASRLRRLRGRAARSRQRGWGASEYLSVLLGLMVVWWGAQRVLRLVQEHHDEFMWALMLPF